jgi:hypothetical protein
MPISMNIFKKIIALALVVSFAGCTDIKTLKREVLTPSEFKASLEEPFQTLQESSPYLKAHMHNGDVYVLREWELDGRQKHVKGTGALHKADREIVRQGDFRVDIDSVAIFETNVVKISGNATALTIFAGITAAVTIYCIANPKACFGSCPTFYVEDNNDLHLKAEGFSASIAPSLEATDIDALSLTAAFGDEFEIEMRNEALETHVVRSADLLALPKESGNRVFADLDGRFWECAPPLPPHSARAPEGNCLPLLLFEDGDERFSKTDSTYLGAKETIEIEFAGMPDGPCGLVVGCRQTLLSTYILYQTFAYMGSNVGYWFARIERSEIEQNENPIQTIMGGIEILIQDSLGEWNVLDEIDEHGPLATDVHLVQLGKLQGSSAKLRLQMTKGNWRINYIALAPIERSAQPVRLQPYNVIKDNQPDETARAILCDSTQSLTTLPGDTYTLQYRIPSEPGSYEIFLQSRGYYLEWIRREWIEEENPILLAEIFIDPEAALKRLAPEFKVSIALLILSLLAVGCAARYSPRGYLEEPRKTQKDTFGGWVRLKIAEKDIRTISGELIALSSDSIFVANETFHALALSNIKSARLEAYNSQAGHMGALVGLGTLLTVSNGIGLLFTAPMWILGGGTATIFQSYEPIIEYPEQELDRLQPFARYPQGLPPGIDRSRITMKIPKSRMKMKW